jgi:Cof subfamily protein (haloacid dehalogenase superfamily)
MNLDAIIFDLDGTAVPNAGNTPSEAMRRAIAECQSQIVLCAATGRSWTEGDQLFAALGLAQPCIISGGTIIINPQTQEIVWQETMPQPAVRAVIATAHKYPYTLMYTQGVQTTAPLSPASIGASPESVNIMYILDIPHDHADVPALIHELEHIDGIAVSKAGAWGIPDGIDLHITSSTATKEHAVIELCGMLGLDRSRVAGVGDGHNDMHLFNAVGYKVAMGNAVPELKAAADSVIASVTDDGLAFYIRQHAGS